MNSAASLWSIIGPMLGAVPRLAVAVAVAPLFPASLFPTLIRGGLVVSLALFLYPRMAADAVPELAPLAWLLLLGKEAFIGVLIGLAMGALVWAFESAGTLIDFQIGFGNAQLFDPFGAHESGPMTSLLLRLGVTLLIMGGGLQMFASLIFDSFELWPINSWHPALQGTFADFVGASFGSLAQLTVRLCMPVVLVLALIDLSFGLINRVVPQLNVFYFTMPIKGALAALMLALYLGYLADIVAANLSDLQNGRGWPMLVH